MATELSETILKHIADNGPTDTLKLAELLNEEHQKIVGAIKSIQALGDVIEAEQVTSTNWELSEEGKQVAEKGSHEALVYFAVPENDGIPQAQLMAKVPNAKVGFSKAMSAGWIALDKSGSNGPLVKRKVALISDVVQEHLHSLMKDQGSLTPQQKQDYKKRKLIQEVIVKSYLVKPGPSFSTSVSKQETDLTADMLASGSWKTKQFKPYNLDALGMALNRGHLHPLLKVRAEFRQIFLEMGFTEMPTNNYVESSFWNFDALFQPQQHPARDAHDTFFISEPAAAVQLPHEYLERVKTVHSVGGYGSVGYGYDWKVEEARKNLLRTHTTAVSARMLHALAQNQFRPAKYFSIDRVFRNETLDATHLAEFHQIEGVVADYGLTLGDLIGTLHEFFRKLGIEKLRFKPAYNPYTEPSLEVFSYHPGLGKWVEVGNSGLFRPEMLLPMGLPEDVTVIAWGLSLERPTMIKYGIDNIRDLVGPKVNLQMVFDNPVCRLDKHRKGPKEPEVPSDNSLESLEQKLDSVMSELEQLQRDIHNLKQKSNPAGKRLVPQELHLIVEADPSHPPEALIRILGYLQRRNHVNLSVHRHSTLSGPVPPNSLEDSCGNSQLRITFIWKPVGQALITKIAKNYHLNEILGEESVSRLIARWYESTFPDSALVYEGNTEKAAAEVDNWIDLATEATTKAAVSALAKKIDQRLKNSVWLAGAERGYPTLADFVTAVRVKKAGVQVPPSVEKWASGVLEL